MEIDKEVYLRMKNCDLKDTESMTVNGNGMLVNNDINNQISLMETDSMDCYHIARGETNPFMFELEDGKKGMQGHGDGPTPSIPSSEETFHTVDLGKSSNDKTTVNVNDWYAEQPPDVSDCPFKTFHHSGLPSEFLQYPFHSTKDKRSQHILAGMNDHSCGIYMKIQFIVNNLKDCLGIWPQLFLQKLNSIIIRADPATVRAVLTKDDFAILKELITYYVNETKCSMVFRYWCLFYNAFRKNLIPAFPTSLKNQLMAQLQKDFSLAGQHLCRCKLGVDCDDNSQCEPDEEHRKISGPIRINMTAVLMYFLICKVADHSDNTCDAILDEKPHQFNSDKFIKGAVVPLFIKLYESVHKQHPSASEEVIVQDVLLMETLSHILVAYHCVPFEKNLFPSAVELMLDMGCLSAAVRLKDMLLNLVKKESIVFQKGSIKLFFIIPEIQICFTTMGMSGVIKCLNSLICNVEYQILSRDEQTFLMDMMVTTQTYLGDCGYWNGECENIYLHCRSLQCTLEKKLGLRLAEVKLDSDSETANSSGFQLPDYFQADSTPSSQTSQSKLHPSRNVSGIDDINDEWMIVTRQVSKLRKGYEHEIMADERTPGCMSMWISRTIDFFINFRKCCSNQN